jgi:hypothetical protein
MRFTRRCSAGCWRLIAKHGLVKGERIGVDASTMEANAALRTIVRRDTGETYREMLKRMAEESGIQTPRASDLTRMDRTRKGKKLSNEDWVSKTDPEAKIARMKDGTTHLAYKPEHAVDLDTGAVVAAEVHPADEGDTTTLKGTLQAAETNLDLVGMAPSKAEPTELIADKGYHARAVQECRKFRVGSIPMETEESPYGTKETTGYCRSVAGSASGWSGREERV